MSRSLPGSNPSQAFRSVCCHPRKSDSEGHFHLLVKQAEVGNATIGATFEMANEITEEEVRDDVMVFANVLFERGMTDDRLSVVDEWVRQWRSGALVSFPCYGRKPLLEGWRP